MSDVIIVAIISGICSLVGTCLGVISSSKLTNYRLEQLESKVNKHNNLVERMYICERDIAIIKQEIADSDDGK